MAARRDHLDLANRRLFIPDAKTGERKQPITLELGELPEREMRDDREGWIFPSPHSDTAAGHRARIDRPLREAVKAAGLNSDGITPHVRRHTAITKLVQAGVDLPTVQRISGHKTLAMYVRYTHVHGRHIYDAIRAIGRTLPKRAANGTENPIISKLHQGAGSGPAEKPVNKPKLKGVGMVWTLEAGSGIEPLYEDLQSTQDRFLGIPETVFCMDPENLGRYLCAPASHLVLTFPGMITPKLH